MVRQFVELKGRLTWNGIRNDVQRRFGFPIATILLTWLGVWLAGKHLALAGTLEPNPQALGNYLAWAALFMFGAWITLPVIIFPLDENLDPQQLAVLPISSSQMVSGLTAASLIAPATLIPIILMMVNGSILLDGWWMILPASAVFMGLLSVGAQLFSAAISSILRTRRGRDIATFLVLGLAAGSFLIYRGVAGSVDRLGLEEAALSIPILDWAPLIPPVAAQRAIVEAASGNGATAILMLAIATAWLIGLALTWRTLMSWMLTTPPEGSRPR